MCALHPADAGGRLTRIVTFLSYGRSVSDPTPRFDDNRPPFAGAPAPKTAQTGVAVPSAHSILVAEINFLEKPNRMILPDTVPRRLGEQKNLIPCQGGLVPSTHASRLHATAIITNLPQDTSSV